MKTIYKFFGIASVVIISLALLSCGNPDAESVAHGKNKDQENTIALTQAQLSTAGIAFGKVEQKQISSVIKVNGTLDVPPQQMISVSVPLGGFLKSTPLLQGSRVKKGQLIAVIENPDFIRLQQDYLEAKNQLEYAQADYDRQKELAKENVNALKTLQMARATHQNWLAKKNGLLATLKLININITNLEDGHISSTANVYSSISGFVTKVNVNIGRFVSPTDVLFVIVDTGHLHAELTVFEKDVPKIFIGQKVRFTLANETRERMATVYLIGREIGTNRTIRIHCHIDTEDKDLLPGMYLKAVIELGATKVNAVPDEAIVNYQGKKYIFLPVEQGHQGGTGNENSGSGGQHFAMVEIEVGKNESGYTEIVLPKNWNMDSRVVVKGAYAILSKSKNSKEEE